MTERPELRVSVFSDYICPFCYVGSMRLLQLEDAWDLRVNWCFLEIHPETPPEGRPVEELGYPPEQWREMMDGLARMAESEGLVIAGRTFTTNSRRALLLAEAAKQEPRETFYRLHRRLFEAFFAERRNIGDPEELRALAAEAEVPTETVEAAWSDPRYLEHLNHYRALAARTVVTGVPTFVIGQRVLAGAVPTATLRAAAEAEAAAGP